MKSGSGLKSETWVRRQALVASVAALVTAGVTAIALPTNFYQASAIVAVDEPSAALRLASSRSAADLVVSKPVIVRAAASLNGTVDPAPAPTFAEKLGAATGLVNVTGAVARLADALVPTVSASAGDGLVEIKARAADGARAARVATTLAEALVAEEEGLVAGEARHREAETAARLAVLRESARVAHVRLASLGGSESDPAEALKAAATAIGAAETRLAAIRVVIAAGSPPLGAGSDLPQSAATLQQTYWDLKKQLDKATETMGERHTTVIALRDGVARAAATLTAEWARIEHGAASDVAVARSREAVLRKTINAMAPGKRVAIDEARGAVHLADAALARATAAPLVSTLVNPPFKLVAPAGVPATATGTSPLQRGLISAAAGIGAFAIAWLALRRRRRRLLESASDEPVARTSAETNRATPEAVDVAMVKASTTSSLRWESLAEANEPYLADAELRRSDYVSEARDIALTHDYDLPFGDGIGRDWAVAEPERSSVDTTDVDCLFDPASFDALFELADFEALHEAAFTEVDPVVSAEYDAIPAYEDTASDLCKALRGVAVDLDMLTDDQATTKVIVAANDSDADTAAVALALGEAGSELGYRMLVIEGERTQTKLAEAVDPEGDPILVEIHGALRVAFPAARGGDELLVAPAFHDGGRLAAELARNGLVDLVDDLASAFDVVVIDAGCIVDSAAAGWSADAFIRVASTVSQIDDAELLDVFEAPEEALLGAVVAGCFVAREAAPELPAAVRPVLRAIPTSLDVTPLDVAAPHGAASNVTALRRTSATPLPPPPRVQARRRLVVR